MGAPSVPGEQAAFRGLFRFGVIGPESAAACQEGAGDSTSGNRFPETRRGFVTVTRPRSGFEPSPAPRLPSEQARCLRGPRSDPATRAKTTRTRPRTRVPSKFDSPGRSGVKPPGDGLALQDIIFATLSASYMYN